VDLHVVVTFPEVTLWRSGVNLTCRVFEIGYLYLYIGYERGFSPVRNRAWIISHFWRAIEPKVADYPRSFSKREIFHARMSENPRSARMTGAGPAFVSICNSKKPIPPLPVTD